MISNIYSVLARAASGSGSFGQIMVVIILVVFIMGVVGLLLTRYKTPRGLVHWKRASCPVEAGTSGFL